MNNFSKGQNGRDYTCKGHSARPDRAELYRICPSKLSKRELEDLYFALLENNLELKRALNGQQDKIKVLSTKVQRMTATQKNAQDKETKECCVATKAVVCEQKNSIADLKTANERMSERIRLLNMRLCSAKQFLRRGAGGPPSAAAPGPAAPAAPAARCSRCCTAPATPLKNLSSSALHTKRSEGNLKPSVSSQYIEKDGCVSTRSVETETQEEEKPTSDRPCDENKCRTLMEELQQKIVNLEEELSNTHEEYSNRISRLEREVSDVRKENVLVRSERIASEHELQQRTRRSGDLVGKLRAAEANSNELTMQLSIEKRKVAELETQLKAANMSNNVAKSIEEHYNNASNTQLLNATKPDRDEKQVPKSTEDSGYMEANRSQDLVDDKGLDKLNEDLMKKISDLETQLDNLKVSTAAEMVQEKLSSKSLHNAVDGVNIKEIKDRVQAADNKYDVSSALEKSVTIASDKEEPMRIGSENNALVTDGNDVAHEEPDTSPPTTAWQEGPSTSQTVCACMDTNGDLNKEESAEAISKDGTRNDAQNPDQHNKLQIPGPIPINGKVWSKSFLKKLSIELKTKTTQQYQTRRNSNEDNQTNDTTTKRDTENIGRSVKSTNLTDIGNKENTTTSIPTCTSTKATNAECTNGVKTQSTDRATDDRDFDTNSYSKDVPDMYRLKSKDSIPVNHSRWYRDCGSGVKEQTPPSLNNLYPSNSNAEAAPADPAPLEFCESQCRVCTCPSAKHRAVSVFRTCSGSLRFTTVDSGCARLRTCDCGTDTYTCDPCGPKVSAGRQAGEPAREGARGAAQGAGAGMRGSSARSVSPPHKHTHNTHNTRATSPENTDNEISSMTDLPSEKDVKSPRPALSPGEDKATTTYTDSYTTPITTDYGSLSEGELPAKSTVRRVSVGETTKIDEVPVVSSSQKMEAALQAITEELARCKQLLQRQKQEERPRAAAAGAGAEVGVGAGCARPIALRRATATQSIGDTQAPKCVFTLHIGTVVLSDEAVLNSRNKTLMLTWQFYDQAVAMTRMRAGRVMLFDFSTEYDIKITDDFLHYMKHEEMPLMICELDKQDEPFASCALPLRDALLHTNRRADMSLALVEGARRAGADELGVLDLWCMLRAEPRLLPAINRAIAEPSLDIAPTRILEQVKEDEQSFEGNMSHDLDLTLAGQGVPRRTSTTRRGSQTVSEVPRRSSALFAARPEPDRPAAAAAAAAATVTTAATAATAAAATATNAATATFEGLDFDVSKYPEMRRHSPRIRRHSLKSGSDRASDIIVNEVEARIKSPHDMKQAVDRSVDQNSLHGLSRPKMDDEIRSLETRASVGSLKGIIAKIHKINRASKKDVAEVQDPVSSKNRKRTSRSSMIDLPPPSGFTENEVDTEIYRKYENMFKTIGSNKPETLKKSVTIFPNHSESMSEEPQRDSRSEERRSQSMSITVLWLALNEECEAMVSSRVQRLYVAYSFLGRGGADLETPVSLPKPKHYVDKCHFNFKKTFQLEEADLPLVGHMARCRAASRAADPNDCIVFSVVSEPPEDPLGLDSCEDIGYAYLYLGDLLEYSAGSPEYTEVTPIRAARGAAPVCGVLAVRVQGLDVARRCLVLAQDQGSARADSWLAQPDRYNFS